MVVAAQIGQWKIKHNKPIYDPSRVHLILDLIEAQNRGPLSNSSVLAIFNEIINQTTEFERQYASDPPNFSCPQQAQPRCSATTSAWMYAFIGLAVFDACAIAIAIVLKFWSRSSKQSGHILHGGSNTKDSSVPLLSEDND